MIQSVEFSGQNINLFAEIEPKVTWVKEWSLTEQLEREQEVLGFSLAGHPIDEYDEYIENHPELRPLQAIHELKAKQRVKAIAYIKAVRVIRTKNNDLMAFVSVSDAESEAELIVFPQQYQRFSSLLVEQYIVYLDGTISLNKREEKQIIINDLRLANTLDLTVERKEITRCYVKIPDFTKATQQIQKL